MNNLDDKNLSINKKDTFIGRIGKNLSERVKNLIIIIVLFLIIIGVYFYLGYITAPKTVVKSQLQSAISDCTKSLTYVNCIDNLAIQTQNISICDESGMVGGARDGCIYNVAKKTNNISECNAIGNGTNYSINCFINLANATKNYSTCASLSMPYSGECIYNLLNSSGFSNASACDKIQNQTYLTTCKDLYYFEKVVDSKNSAGCSNISNKTNYIDMMSILNTNKYNLTVTQGELGNVSSFIGNYEEFLNFTPRDYCYYKIAAELNNSQTCNNIGVTEDKLLCNSMFIKPAAAPNINLTAPNITAACSNNKNSSSIAECNSMYLYNQAIKTDNVSACNKFNNQTSTTGLTGLSFSDNCKFILALYSENESICDMVSNQSLKTNCIAQISTLKNITASISNLNSTLNKIKYNYTGPNVST